MTSGCNSLSRQARVEHFSNIAFYPHVLLRVLKLHVRDGDTDLAAASQST